MDFVAFVVAAAESEGFALDQSQRTAATRLQILAQSLIDGDVAKGLYLWGPVGRGKTWLLDRFYEYVPIEAKRRFHFHDFFRQFHTATRGHPLGRGALPAALDDLLDGVDLLCFDEFYVHEHGDAALLTLVLRELTARRAMTLVMTSNFAPSELLADAIYRTSSKSVEVSHRMFDEGRALLLDAVEPVSVDQGEDYRLRAADRERPLVGFRAGCFAPPVRPPFTAGPITLGLAGGRTVEVLGEVDRTLWVRFESLCDRPLAAADIVGLTVRYRDWVITDLVPLDRCSPETAQRFVDFVDVWHDADVRVTLLSDSPRKDLLGMEEPPPGHARMVSRLAMLPSSASCE